MEKLVFVPLRSPKSSFASTESVSTMAIFSIFVQFINSNIGIIFFVIVMNKIVFTGKLKEFIEKANRGFKDDIDYIFSHLTHDSTFAMTRYVDYALSLVENEQGINQIEYYLFKGTSIQRNYSSLYFNRRWEYDIVEKAYEEGLLDEIQAFTSW